MKIEWLPLFFVAKYVSNGPEHGLKIWDKLKTSPKFFSISSNFWNQSEDLEFKEKVTLLNRSNSMVTLRKSGPTDFSCLSVTDLIPPLNLNHVWTVFLQIFNNEWRCWDTCILLYWFFGDAIQDFYSVVQYLDVVVSIWGVPRYVQREHSWPCSFYDWWTR